MSININLDNLISCLNFHEIKLVTTLPSFSKGINFTLKTH